MVIRQNRAVPILLVLTFAFILYLGGCFGSEEPSTATDETPTAPPVVTPTAPPVVGAPTDPDAPLEDPFYYTIEQDDRLAAIASKFGVTVETIMRANPDLDQNRYFAGQQILIPGATTNAEAAVSQGPDRPDGVTVSYEIASGDTFGALASEWTVGVDALGAANPDIDPNALQVGQIIEIPPWGTGIDASELRPRTTPVPVQRQPGEVLIHTVAAGDFISSIAELYGVSIGRIVEVNDLPDGGNNIQVGQELTIPPPPTPTPTAEPVVTPESG